MDDQRPYRNPSPPPPSPVEPTPTSILNVYRCDLTSTDNPTSPLPVLTDIDVFLPILPSPNYPPKKIDPSLNIPLQPVHNIFDNDILNLDNVPTSTTSHYTPDEEDFLLNTYNLLSEDIYLPNSIPQAKLSRPNRFICLSKQTTTLSNN